MCFCGDDNDEIGELHLGNCNGIGLYLVITDNFRKSFEIEQNTGLSLGANCIATTTQLCFIDSLSSLSDNSPTPPMDNRTE